MDEVKKDLIENFKIAIIYGKKMVDGENKDGNKYSNVHYMGECVFGYLIF